MKQFVELFISDTQAPFHHPDTIKFLTAIKKKYKPNDVYHVGDELDFHMLSSWLKDPDGYGSSEEFEKGIEFMHELYKLFPKCKACNSNHTDRPLRKAFEAGLPKIFLKDKKEWMEAPEGWLWADEWYTKYGAKVIHGDGLTGGASILQKSMKDNMCPVIFGHFHTKSAVSYFANAKILIYSMCVGCLIDHKLYAFKYQKKNQTKPIISVGITINGTPMIIPMWLTKSGRWNRSIL